MEFQVYSVLLEDRYPRGFPPDHDKTNLFDQGFPHTLKGELVEKERGGCIAFVFGRTQDGRSVCVRVEGVRPKLFFKLEPGDTLASMRLELEKEVKARLGDTGCLQTSAVRFAHDYGYEYDPDTPSKRAVHEYVEVRYPSLTTWRMACKLRRREMFRDIRAKIRESQREADDLVERMLKMRKAMMSGAASDATIAEAYKRMELREVLLREQILVGLKRREESLYDEEFEHGDVDVDATSAQQRIRPAQEYFVEPVTRFLYEADITPSGWVSVATTNPVKTPVSVCDIELQAQPGDFRRIERDLDAPYTVLYYDIETLGLDPQESPVIQISMVFVTDGARRKYLVALGTVAPLPGVIVHECHGEAELLSTFRRVLLERDPDFVVAYNGVNFDNRYLAVRSERGKALASSDVDDFWYTSRFAFRPARLRELRLSSSGMGDNLLRYIDMPGRTNFDWFIKLKRDLTSEPKYSLNHFATKFCGLQKEDMDYKEIPVLQAGSAADRARLGSYCVVDSDLLEDLNQARTMIVEILQFSAVFGVLAEWVYFRGQQVRFISILLKKARTAEAVPLLLNRPSGGFCGEGVSTFEGATVNEPRRGFHKDLPVATLDWMSLYPSIMRAYNLCHSTHVLDPNLFDAPGVVAFRIGEDDVAHFVTAARHKGILPRILEELHAARKAAKKKVKEHTLRSKDAALDPEERAKCTALSKVFDGRQLALKVSMNSVYGACGATDTGKFPDLAISATVTLQGREAMVVKKRILPERFPGIDVVYGDSIAEHTPLLVVVRGITQVLTPCQLWEHACGWQLTCDGKEAAAMSGVFTWSERGWARVDVLLRHRTGKQLFRVATPSGIVDVTEDHSLLHADGTVCRPEECVPQGTALLHAWPSALSSETIAPPSGFEPLSLSRILGMFLVESSGADELDWAIVVLSVVVADGAPPIECDEIVTLLREWCLASDGTRMVPHFVLNGGTGVREAFAWGVHHALLAKGGEWIQAAGERLTLGLYAILRSTGRRVHVRSDPYCMHTYHLRLASLEARASPSDTVVLEVRPIVHTGEYVYDLTTETHHFHAGVGQLIVHNTDSVMVTFADAPDVHTCGVRGEEASAFVTDYFARHGYPEMVLEFEKCYFPYLLQGKKRYAGLKYEPEGDGTMVCKGIDCKGIETERRDALPFVKDIMRDCLHILMYKRDEQLALAAFREKMRSFVDGEVAFDKFIMRKNLSAKAEKKPDTLVQARVNALRRAREPGSEASINEQVEYVIVNGWKKEKTTQLAEDPAYARAQGLKLNLLWYFEHTIREPVKKLFEVFDTIPFAAICSEISARLDSKRLGLDNSIRNLFGASAAASTSIAEPSTSAAVHVPRPPPPRKKAKKAATNKKAPL